MRLSLGSSTTQDSGQRLNQATDSVASFRLLHVRNWAVEPEWTTSDSACRVKMDEVGVRFNCGMPSTVSNTNIAVPGLGFE